MNKSIKLNLNKLIKLIFNKYIAIKSQNTKYRDILLESLLSYLRHIFKNYKLDQTVISYIAILSENKCDECIDLYIYPIENMIYHINKYKQLSMQKNMIESQIDSLRKEIELLNSGSDKTLDELYISLNKVRSMGIQKYIQSVENKIQIHIDRRENIQSIYDNLNKQYMLIKNEWEIHNELNQYVKNYISKLIDELLKNNLPEYCIRIFDLLDLQNNLLWDYDLIKVDILYHIHRNMTKVYDTNKLIEYKKLIKRMETII